MTVGRTFDAPRERVFEAMTDPDQVDRWWGPDGFSTATEEMNVRPGGTWRFVTVRPDGEEYPNRIVSADVSTWLDGFVAVPTDGRENPLGDGRSGAPDDLRALRRGGQNRFVESHRHRTRTDTHMTDDATLAIATTGLRKSFGDTLAVDGIDLRIPRGTVYGLLGPNGAGKTTTIRMLATLLRPDGGSATVLGHDVVAEAAEVRATVSLTGQYASIDEDLTGRENLILVGRLLGLGWRAARVRADELLSAFGLADAATRQVRTYSGGMKRRLDVAASLIVTPEVLFLDEPTTGLDPRSRNQVWAIIRAIADEGATVLLTTQYLDEADRLADRLAVIDQGRVIAEGTSRELKAAVGASTLRVRLHDPERRGRAETILADLAGVEILDGIEREALSARVPDERRAADALTALVDAGVGVAEFSLGQASLDEVFLALTGKPAEELTEEAIPAGGARTEARP